MISAAIREKQGTPGSLAERQKAEKEKDGAKQRRPDSTFLSTWRVCYKKKRKEDIVDHKSRTSYKR